ncbi:MAG: hypothetical protein ABIW82_17390 [Dokdonella sp.]
MSEDPLDYLDKLAVRVAVGETDLLGPLSRGECIYVALAANRPDQLPHDTIAEALARLGPEWTQGLIERWQYRGDPAKQ